MHHVAGRCEDMQAYLFVHFREKTTPDGEQVYLVLAIEYGLDADLMGSLTFTNVVLSVFTLTAIIGFLS